MFTGPRRRGWPIPRRRRRAISPSVKSRKPRTRTATPAAEVWSTWIGVLRRRLAARRCSRRRRFPAHDRELVAGGIAQISRIPVRAVILPRSRAAFIAAAGLHRSVVKRVNLILGFGIEANHDAVAGA